MRIDGIEQIKTQAISICKKVGIKSEFKIKMCGEISLIM